MDQPGAVRSLRIIIIDTPSGRGRHQGSREGGRPLVTPLRRLTDERPNWHDVVEGRSGGWRVEPLIRGQARSGRHMETEPVGS
jgi:hypothetical protein